MKKVFNFIKYNNLFTLVVVFIMLGSGVSLAATPEVRAGIISSKDTVRSVDNSYLLTADIANHNFNLKVTNITEDPDNYYVDYTYSTIAVQDYVWKDITLNKRLTVSKEALGNKDLGLFVEEQLGQEIDSELVYLKESQKIEISKGLTQKVISTEYAGLIGSMFSPSEKVFEGYVPVKPPEIDATTTIIAPQTQPESARSKSVPGGVKTQAQLELEALQAQKDALAQQVRDLLNAQQNQSTTTPDTTSTTTPPNSTTTTPPDSGTSGGTSGTGGGTGSTTPPDSGTTTPPTSGTTTPPDSGTSGGTGGSSGTTTPPDSGSTGSGSSGTSTTPTDTSTTSTNSTGTTSSTSSSSSSSTSSSTSSSNPPSTTSNSTSNSTSNTTSSSQTPVSSSSSTDTSSSASTNTSSSSSGSTGTTPPANGTS